MSILKKLIKINFIAFIRDGATILAQKVVAKNNKILHTENLSFDEEEEFENFIKKSFIENTQTYVSTTINSLAQGCVDSCNHSKYKELSINIDNIKILCIDNKFSIFVGLYELNKTKKDNERFLLDYLFSPFALTHSFNKKTPNSLYILTTKMFASILIYEQNNIPKYSNIICFEDLDNHDTPAQSVDNSVDADDSDIEEISDIESIEDIEDIEDIETDIDTTLDDEELQDETEIDADKLKTEMERTQYEMEIVEFLKNSLKEYYENYSNNFVENIYLLHNQNISTKFTKIIQDELFLEIKPQQIDLLETINNLAIKESNV